MRCRRIQVAAWMPVAAAALLLPGPARAATNLIADPGFETAGGSAVVFADSLPDGTAWTVEAGSFSITGGVIAPVAQTGSDIAVVTNSGDYRDGVFEAQVTPLPGRSGPYGGLVFRHRDAGDFYGCALVRGSLALLKRTGGADQVLRQASTFARPNTPVWLRATAVGSSLTCDVLADAGGAPGAVQASVAATDASYASGQVGVFDTDPSGRPGQYLRFALPQMSAAVPAAWSGIAAAAGRPGEVPDRVAPANSGSESMQLFGGSTTFDGSSQQAGIAVTGSTVYTLQAAIRTAAVTGGQAEVVAVESPSGTTTVLGGISSTTAWTVYSTTFVTQPGTTSLTIRTRLAGSGTANFDDLSLTAGASVSLTLSSASANLGAVSPAGSPFAYPGAVVATVTATAGWTLSVSGSGPFSDGAGHTLPIANLAWRLAGGGTYTPFATTPATVATGAATGSSGAAVALDYQLSVSYSDPSSSSPYTTSLTYIATTP